MPQINLPLLLSINDAVNMSFNTQLYATASLYKKWSFLATSTGRSELYPRLDMLPGLRRWTGDRVVYDLSAKFFTIENEPFEETIRADAHQVEDDQYGFLSGVAAQIGQDAAQQPDLMTTGLFRNGTTQPTYDGQYFFDTAHPNYNALGQPTALPNYMPASNGYTGPSWYLLDTSKVQKPFIFQTRQPFRIVPKFALTDNPVFFDKEIIWGVDGRCAAGYGLWQLAYRSDNALTVANLETARAAMAALRRPNGTPMGIGMTGLQLVVPTSLYPQARAYCENEFLPAGDPLVGTSGTASNTFKGLATAIENPWLN